MPFISNVTNKMEGVLKEKNLHVWKADGLPYHILRDASSSFWWFEPDVESEILYTAPRNETEVAQIIRIAGQLGVKVIVRGGGSGLGGVLPYESDVPYVIMDLKGIDGLLKENEKCSLASFGAGTLGIEAERIMARQRRTLGNLPMSLAFSTLGGWAATDAAGHFSTYYGRTSDLLTSVRLVDGRGDIHEFSRTDSDFHLIVGSEGILGVITAVELLTFPQERFWFRAFKVPDMYEGLEVFRYLTELCPAPVLLRLHDPLDSLVSGILEGINPPSSMVSGLLAGLSGFRNTLMPLMLSGGKLLTSWAENILSGDNISPVILLGYVADEMPADTIEDILRDHGAVSLGPAPVLRWLGRRHDMASEVSVYSSAGLMIDTAEFSVPWKFINQVYEDIRDVLASRALTLVHISHPDISGASVYFTFVFKPFSREEYDLLWSDMAQTVSRYSAAISHHHGMGRLKGRFIHLEHGPGVIHIRNAKSRFDPLNIMNPGVLL